MYIFGKDSKKQLKEVMSMSQQFDNNTPDYLNLANDPALSLHELSYHYDMSFNDIAEVRGISVEELMNYYQTNTSHDALFYFE